MKMSFGLLLHVLSIMADYESSQLEILVASLYLYNDLLPKENTFKIYAKIEMVIKNNLQGLRCISV